MKSNPANFYFSTPDEAESAFYSAFEMGDLVLMKSVLANHDGCCIHPGSLPVIGREQILNSWSKILSQMKPPVINIEVLSRSEFNDIAVHVVAEYIAMDHQPDSAKSLVLATNIYLRQNNGWRLLEHHASLSNQPQSQTITHTAHPTLQ